MRLSLLAGGDIDPGSINSVVQEHTAATPRDSLECAAPRGRQNVSAQLN